MLNNVQQSKYISDTISIVLSFADLLSPGDTISGVPVITVTVSSGVDSNPSNLLYEGVSVTQGSIVEQRFRLGVPGVIYHILYSVGTVAGDTLEKDTTLAILPEGTDVTPTWLPLWESTQLYPYQLTDSLTSHITMTSGRLAVVVYSIPAEYIQSKVVWLGGTLIGAGVTYNIPHEDLKGSLLWIGGTLVESGITYSNDYDSLKGALAWIGGELQNASITYNIPHEDLKGSITFTGGSLV